MSLTYTKTLQVRGDSQKALDFAANMLARDSFELVTKTRNRLEAVNTTGWYYKSQPFQGLSRVEVLVGPGTVTLNADLGGVRKVVWATAAILLILCISVISTTVASQSSDAAKVGLLSLIPGAASLPVVRLYMSHILRKKMDTLVDNLAQAAQQPAQMCSTDTGRSDTRT